MAGKVSKSGRKKSAPAPAKERRSLFVREYLIDRNATQAAIRAGYSPKTAYSQASRLLKDVEIAAEIDAATRKTTDKLAAKFEITKERVLEELAKIAFADPSAYAKWGPDLRTIIDRNGGAHVTSGVELVPSDDLTPAALGAISEISEGPQGVKLKFHDKRGALDMLGKELGMFKEKVEHDFASPLAVLVDAVQRQAAPLPVQEPNAGRVLRQEAPSPAPAASSPATTPATISPLLRPGGA